MVLAKQKKQVPLFTRAEIDAANDCAVLLWNGVDFSSGKKIVSDRDFLVYFSDEFSNIGNKGHVLHLSRPIIHDLIIISMLKPMYRKQNELTYPGLERYISQHYPSAKLANSRTNHGDVRLGVATEFTISCARAVVKKNVSVKAGYRVPFASRLLFFAAPQLLVFNYANRLAEKKMLYQSRPHYAYPTYANDMLNGLRKNWKLLSKYNLPTEKKGIPEKEVIIAHNTDWWARRVLDIALLIHFGVFSPSVSLSSLRRSLVYTAQSRTTVSCP